MATFTSRTMTSTRREWIIPVAEPWGTASAEIGKGWAAAEIAYREHYNLPDNHALADDALRFHVTDDAIVITFTAEAEGVPQRGTHLCHDTDPTTLKECALGAGHPGNHADANVRWEPTR